MNLVVNWNQYGYEVNLSGRSGILSCWFWLYE
jgi:hypothetical protein